MRYTILLVALSAIFPACNDGEDPTPIAVNTSVGTDESLAPEPPEKEPELACKDCHFCRNPSAHFPTLKNCPHIGPDHDICLDVDERGPEAVVFDQLEDRYEPVEFPHEKHAHMASEVQGCDICHHCGDIELYLPCHTCHTVEIDSSNLDKPTLKGAYHRQCLKCHGQWGDERDCAQCHVEKAQTRAVAAGNGLHQVSSEKKSRSMNADAIQVPQKKIFTTHLFTDGPLVTLNHKEHVDLYRFRCVDCHQEDSCEKCHEKEGREGVKSMKSVLKKMEEYETELGPQAMAISHKDCFSCHDTNDQAKCGYCHKNTETEGFIHDLTGWPLPPFHRHLGCDQCHREEGPIRKTDSDCYSCHEDWDEGAFDHAVVGLKLNEDHLELECIDCHEEMGFNIAPICTGCHEEEGYLFPDKIPGEIVERSIQDPEWEARFEKKNESDDARKEPQEEKR